MGEKNTSGEHLYLVDGSSYIFRAYYAIKANMTRSDGTPTKAVYGFTTMLWKLLEDLKNSDEPTHLAVIFDAARRSFRNDIYPDYKAHRPDAPEDLVPQFPLIREATEAFHVPAIEMEGFEADDIIATYARQAAEQGFRVTIVSSDKDLMQLVDDQITLFDAMKNARIGPNEVREKFGVGPDKVIEVQALAGDSVDNVPGVPGIGIKTAAQLIEEYGDLDTLLEKAEDVKQQKRRENLIEFAEQARISKELVTLKCDVPLERGLDDLVVHDPAAEPLLKFLDDMEFRSLKVKWAPHLDPEGLQQDSMAAELSMDKQDYECIQTMEALDRWINAIRKAGVVAVDTETNMLNPMRARLVGISFSIEAGKACYIPLRHGSGNGDGLNFEDAPKQIPTKEALAALKAILEDPSILKVGQNIKYDLQIFAHEGIAVSPVDDTMLISYVLEGGEHGHGMDELSELHLEYKPISFKEVAGTGKSQKTFDQIELEPATKYAAEDADITGRLYRLLKPELASTGLMTVYETLERPMVPVLMAMERHGIKIDRDQLARLSNEFAKGLDDLEGKIHKEAGREFNIGSPKQLGEILFDEMGLEGGKKGKTGAYTTSADVLEKLAAEGHKLPQMVLDWRQLSKLRSTYTEALQKEINEETGRVHTSFTLAGTTTGRLSSSDPNVQNIPIRTEEGRKIRAAFVAEKGCKLISADYSQIELRILAHIAGIESLQKAFADGQDIHAMTASEVFDVPMKDMDPDTRRRAKAINFGIIYGISAFGLAKQLGVSREEAKDYIDTYFERFPGIRDYMERTKERAKRHGYVTTLFGRRCHVPALRDKVPSVRAFGERAAINAPIQGSAADIIRRAMIRMPDALKDAGLNDVKMLLQVHDELIFEAPEDKVEEAQKLIKDIMQNAPRPVLKLDVPLIVECGAGDNWQEAH